MALDVSAGAAAYWAVYSASVGLKSDGSYDPNGTVDTSTFAADFASSYNNYASQGIVLGATNTGGTTALLEAMFSDPVDPNAVGTAFANYWATVAVTPGIPSHGGSVVISVTNDAASKAAAFTTALQNSITSTKSTPFFEAYWTNLESVVSTIIWTVTELVGSTPTAFPESIS